MEERVYDNRRKFDWDMILAAYLADPTLTHDQIAVRFGASPASIKIRSSKYKWADKRVEVKARVDAALQDKVVEQKLRNADDYNLEDIKLGRAMRSEIAREFNRLKSSGKTDYKALKMLADAHQTVQKTTRLAMGLATTSSELTGKGGEPLNAAVPVINVNFVGTDNDQAA